MFALWQVDLVSGNWKVIGVTTTQKNAEKVTSELMKKDPTHYVNFNEVPQFEEVI
jgi:hypothetical protein